MCVTAVVLYVVCVCMCIYVWVTLKAYPSPERHVGEKTLPLLGQKHPLCASDNMSTFVCVMSGGSLVYTFTTYF